MFQQEEMNDQRPLASFDDAGERRWEEAPFRSGTGQKLTQESSGSVPTAVQRLALALVSLGMGMGTTILLILVALQKNTPSWAVIPILFALTLFTVTVVSINVVFHRNVR